MPSAAAKKPKPEAAVEEQPASQIRHLDYTPRGNVRALFMGRDREILLDGPAGTGKAQPLDATVWTPFGPVRMEEIRVGDEVLHPSGGRSTVVSIHPQGEQDVYRLVFSGGDTMESTADHLFEVFESRSRKNHGRRWHEPVKTVKTLAQLAGDYLIGTRQRPRYWVPQCASCDLESADIPVPPYTLGVLLGDGHLRNGSITFTSADPDIAAAVQQELGSGYNVKYRPPYTYSIIRSDGHRYQRKSSAKPGYVSQTASGKWMARVRDPGGRSQRYAGSYETVALAEEAIAARSGEAFNEVEQNGCGIWNAIAALGLEGTHSWDKFIPTVYKRSPHRLAVLQGLLDTDGTADIGTGMPSFTSTSQQLALDVKEIVESLGGICTVTLKHPSGGRTAYNCWIRLNDTKTLFRLKRKADRARRRTKYPVKRMLLRIESVGRKPCQCIRVSAEDGLYLTDHCIVTHNSRGCIEKLNGICERYQGARCAMVRKTRVSLTQSGMVTFEQRVMPFPEYIPFHNQDQEYRYPNGSIIAVGGLDNPSKLYSSDWDVIYVQQAEELIEDEWQSVLRGLRNWKLPYQQLIGDCNPAGPTHWIRSRAATGALRLLPTKHEDNPELYDDQAKTWTDRGKQYIAILDGYTGVLYKRLRLGLWAAAEGMVYEDVWDRVEHVVPRFEIPRDWPRYWAIDFGYTNPFAWAAYAQDPDGRLYLYREVYHTKRTVSEHSKTIMDVTKDDPKPRAVICDHDAEDRATFERETGLRTRGAWKAVSAGIQAMHERLKAAGDGKPRLFYLENSVVDIDPELLARHEPVSSEQEYEVYVWDVSNNRRGGEEPVKKYDHGKDRDRYLITFIDETWKRSKPTNMAIPIITRSGDQNEQIDLERRSPWHF